MTPIEEYNNFISRMDEEMKEETRKYIETDYTPITEYPSLKAIRTEFGPKPFAQPPTKSKIRMLIRHIKGYCFFTKLRIMALIGLHRRDK